MGGCYSCCTCRSTPDDKEKKARKRQEKERDEARKDQEKDERTGMFKQAESYIRGRYVVKKRLDDLGSRLQKYWMKIEYKPGDKEDGERKSYILSVLRFSSVCPLGNREAALEKIGAVKNLFEELNKHYYIQEIKEIAIDRIEDSDTDVVIFIQKEFPEGSLRDIIHGLDKDEYMKNWSDKARRTEISDKFQQLAKDYAIQILEGMLFLKKIGFPHLGNIHLGNIFLATGDEKHPEGICKISGHENTLFGYRTSIFRAVAQSHGYLEGIDVIMFGRILFELATCMQLSCDEVFPTEQQIERIKDDQLKYLLRYIFERSDTKIIHSLEQVLKKLDDVKWYQRRPPRDLMKGVDKRKITREMKDMLRNIKL